MAAMLGWAENLAVFSKFRLHTNAILGYHLDTRITGATWPSGKARVCKTLTHGFDSHRRLFSYPQITIPALTSFSRCFCHYINTTYTLTVCIPAAAGECTRITLH